LIRIRISEEGVERRGEYPFETFEQRFLEICEEHRETGRALAFAFILYDAGQPQVIKALRDSDYWAALDKLSGKHLTVFSFEATLPRGEVIEHRWMARIPGSGDAGARNQLLLRSYFRIDAPVTLPAVMFFQVDNGEVVDCLLWQLKGSRIEDVYIALETVIGAAAKAVQSVPDEHKHDALGIFHLIRQALMDEKFKMVISEGNQKLRNLGGITSLIRLLLVGVD
jgi:hypothetical protein